MLGVDLCPDPALRGTPVLLTVPLHESADPEHWRQQGFAAMVTKPVKQNELGACLASLLSVGPATVRELSRGTTLPNF